MKDFILELLADSAADGWTVRDEVSEGWEFYFIRHKLDQNRIRHTEHITLTVYKKSDDGKYFGRASAKLAPTADREETKALIESLVSEAALVKNPYYELTQPADIMSKELTSSVDAEKNMPALTVDAKEEECDISRIAGDFICIMKDLPETDGEDINSYEIFVDRINCRYVSSTGIDISYTYPVSQVEVIVNARKDEHEIELYRMFKSGTCDSNGLKEEIIKAMQYGKDKLRAKKTPSLGTCDVVLSTDAALEIYEYFTARMSCDMKYMGISDWEIGREVAEGIVGDKVTVEARQWLPNSSANAAYDAEGAPRRDMMIIKDGIAENRYGSRQFSQYLGLADSFIPGNFAVSGGTKTAAEIRTGRYLEIVEFSDFQVSTLNGDVFGEIRLGYLHDGDQTTAVEGGSVSGTMLDCAKDIQMSAELKQYNNMLIPEVTRLKGVNITGAE